ncbi:MAG: cation diffusion facilitator family transporter [Lachnospiraceae bacterium]|nr:cation diffusion facilitator family transporter [Lachnospiraceae bacterium]
MDPEKKNESLTPETLESRDRIIVRTSVIGILANVFLAAFKAVIGLLSNSIAVVLDAVNNLSDALSSVITIVGTKLAGKRPDKKHPLGYGRIEYLSAMIVSAIVLYAGITSLVESIKKIIHPETPDYSRVSLIIIAAAVIVKIILGRFVKSRGEKAGSQALVASGKDATFDAVLSASVLASAVIFLATGVSIEAFVGAVIAVIIIKSGIEMMIETLNDILGQRADADTVREIRGILTELPEVRGAYDLIIYNFGPNRDYASVHLELPDTMTAEEIDRLTRSAQIEVFQRTGVILTGVSVYSYNTSNDEAALVRESVRNAVMAHDWALQMHGFYADAEAKTMRFDVVIGFEIGTKEALAQLYAEVGALYPDWQIMIVPDVDVADL